LDREGWPAQGALQGISFSMALYGSLPLLVATLCALLLSPAQSQGTGAIASLEREKERLWGKVTGQAGEADDSVLKKNQAPKKKPKAKPLPPAVRRPTDLGEPPAPASTESAAVASQEPVEDRAPDSEFTTPSPPATRLPIAVAIARVPPPSHEAGHLQHVDEWIDFEFGAIAKSANPAHLADLWLKHESDPKTRTEIQRRLQRVFSNAGAEFGAVSDSFGNALEEASPASATSTSQKLMSRKLNTAKEPTPIGAKLHHKLTKAFAHEAVQKSGLPPLKPLGRSVPAGEKALTASLSNTYGAGAAKKVQPLHPLGAGISIPGVAGATGVAPQVILPADQQPRPLPLPVFPQSGPGTPSTALSPSVAPAAAPQPQQPQAIMMAAGFPSKAGLTFQEALAAENRKNVKEAPKETAWPFAPGVKLSLSTASRRAGSIAAASLATGFGATRAAGDDDDATLDGLDLGSLVSASLKAESAPVIIKNDDAASGAATGAAELFLKNSPALAHGSAHGPASASQASHQGHSDLRMSSIQHTSYMRNLASAAAQKAAAASEEPAERQKMPVQGSSGGNASWLVAGAALAAAADGVVPKEVGYKMSALGMKWLQGIAERPSTGSASSSAFAGVAKRELAAVGLGASVGTTVSFKGRSKVSAATADKELEQRIGQSVAVASSLSSESRELSNAGMKAGMKWLHNLMSRPSLAASTSETPGVRAGVMGGLFSPMLPPTDLIPADPEALLSAVAGSVAEPGAPKGKVVAYEVDPSDSRAQAYPAAAAVGLLLGSGAGGLRVADKVPSPPPIKSLASFAPSVADIENWNGTKVAPTFAPETLERPSSRKPSRLLRVSVATPRQPRDWAEASTALSNAAEGYDPSQKTRGLSQLGMKWLHGVYERHVPGQEKRKKQAALPAMTHQMWVSSQLKGTAQAAIAVVNTSSPKFVLAHPATAAAMDYINELDSKPRPEVDEAAANREAYLTRRGFARAPGPKPKPMLASKRTTQVSRPMASLMKRFVRDGERSLRKRAGEAVGDDDAGEWWGDIVPDGTSTAERVSRAAQDLAGAPLKILH